MYEEFSDYDKLPNNKKVFPLVQIIQGHTVYIKYNQINKFQD